MTTIVVDRKEGVMVSDNQNTLAGIMTACRKIFKMKEGPNKGTLVGTVGAPGPCFIFMEWFTTHDAHNFTECYDDNQLMQVTDEEDFWCILLTPQKKIMIVDRFFVPEEIPAPYHAIGSGGNIALGAMDAGATAQDAVDIACARDTFSSKMGRALREMKVD